jgi:ribosomal protein S18 acetylase RimI-like enzyme
MRIRRLGPGDEDEILRAARLFDAPPVPEAVRAYLADARNVFLLADEDGQATGFLRGTELGQLRSERTQMFLYEIGVDARCRRRGLGRALVRRLLELCQERGVAEVFVLTDPANEAAVRLYVSTGAVTETPADRMYVYVLRPREGSAAASARTG